MERARKGWVRGALVLGVAGTMMAVAMLSPALAVRLATTGFVKQKVNAARGALQNQINTATAASAAQTYLRTDAAAVLAGGSTAAEISCPPGMLATSGGVAVSNGGLVMNDSAPTDSTGTFAGTFGLGGGAGYTGWGGIVTDLGGGGGTMRVYAVCRTATQTGSNYTSGLAAVRTAGQTWTNVAESFPDEG